MHLESPKVVILSAGWRIRIFTDVIIMAKGLSSQMDIGKTFEELNSYVTNSASHSYCNSTRDIAEDWFIGFVQVMCNRSRVKPGMTTK